jgi:hypothetical protein
MELNEAINLAVSSLEEAFHNDFSALVAEYVAAGAGLEGWDIEDRLQAAADVRRRDEKAAYPKSERAVWCTQLLHIGTTAHCGWYCTTPTLAAAIATPGATTVLLQGKKILERGSEIEEWQAVASLPKTQ